MLEYFDLEYAIRGDGEEAMLEFVNRVESHESLSGLEGLIIRSELGIIQDSEPNRIADLDSIPFPRPFRYVDINRYRRFGSPLHIQTKRGCALNCSYCTYNKIEGKKYRLRSPALIADEIEILVRETGIRHLEFTDSIFNVPASHAKEVLMEVRKKDLKLRLHTMGLSPSYLDEELADLMKSAGFNEADIGAESLCNEVLESLSKNFTRDDIINAADLLKRKNIPATWFILLGAPAETRETVIETLDTIGRIASKWDLVFISTGIRVYNGAPVANEVLKNNKSCTDDNFLHPVKIQPVKISLEEIHSIAEDFAFRFPNFYFYEKETIITGWLLILGNFLLKMFHSRQPVWRLLILLRRIERALGLFYLKRGIHALQMRSGIRKYRRQNGFSLIKNEKNQ
jgi:radical SAM superfamily enzyme YgiQ (UPF0313 family)